jgi:hypothetical protein
MQWEGCGDWLVGVMSGDGNTSAGEARTNKALEWSHERLPVAPMHEMSTGMRCGPLAVY